MFTTHLKAFPHCCFLLSVAENILYPHECKRRKLNYLIKTTETKCGTNVTFHKCKIYFMQHWNAELSSGAVYNRWYDGWYYWSLHTKLICIQRTEKCFHLQYKVKRQQPPTKPVALKSHITCGWGKKWQ